MAGFLSLPSKELAQERRRNCKPLYIALSGCITGLIYPIFAFRHRDKNILFSYIGIAAFVVLWRQFFEIEPSDDFFYNPVTSLLDKSFNFFIYSKYGPFILHFTSIFVITHASRKEAKLNFVRPLTNEKDAFPLKIRKTTSILKKIFDIDNEKAKDIYDEAKELAKEQGRELPLIDDLNETLTEVPYMYEPVQFTKKDGLKIASSNSKANKTMSKANKKDPFAFFKKNLLYPIGFILGIFIARVAKEVISNLISN